MRRKYAMSAMVSCTGLEIFPFDSSV